MKFIFVIVFSFLAFFSLNAQFEQRFGTNYYDRARAVTELQSDDLLIVGTTEGFGQGGNGFMIRTTPQGQPVWIKDYEGINFDEIHSVFEIPENRNLLMAGTTGSFGFGETDAFAMKTDSLGQVIWAKTYGNIFTQNFYKIVRTAFGRYYIVGRSGLVDNNPHAVIIKLDEAGNILWAKGTFDSTASGDWNGLDMCATQDGGAIMVTHSGVNATAGIYKVNDAGIQQWSSTLSAGNFSSGWTGVSVIENSAGEILLFFGLSTNQTIAQSADVWVAKFSSSGSLLWAKSYGGTYTDQPRSIVNKNGGGYLLTGITNSIGNGAEDGFFISIDDEGEVEWAKAYGYAWDDRPYDGVQAKNGDMIMIGQTFPIGADFDSSKVWMVRAGQTGNGPCSMVDWNVAMGSQNLIQSAASPLVTHPIESMDFTWQPNDRYMYNRNLCGENPVGMIENDFESSAYPNPFNDVLHLKLENSCDVRVTLRDLSGKIVFEEINAQDCTRKIYLGNLPSGVYFLSLNSMDKASTIKVMKF